LADSGRRLAAIMFTDMAGFTSLGQRDEALAVELLEEQRGIVRPLLANHNGREVKTIGDAFLVEFQSSLEAVKCAVEIQSSLKKANQVRPESRRLLLRIGIHLGDVIHTGTDVAGDAVNVASRIEPLAPPGGICVSAQVQESVSNKAGVAFESMGVQELKNVAKPMEVYWVQGYGVPTRRPVLRKAAQPADRVAVLPFANMSPDPNDEYFADGMTEELINRLAQVKSLKVIARTSVMSFKGEKKKAVDIAKELDVGTLVEGSVRKAGNRVRVTVQLISAGREEHLWSSHYDKELDNIFAVQSEIAEKVAGELKVQLLESEKKILEKKPTENTEAYNDFLRGRELYREMSEPSLRQALALFEKAAELDPSFARAHVGVAECHQTLAEGGYEPVDVSLPIVKASLRRALELDPDLPEAHSSLSILRFNEDDNIGAEAEARRAIELNPSLPEPYWQLYELAATKGEPEEAIRLIETAYRLDPIRPAFIGVLGDAYAWTGREQEALEHWRRNEQLAPAQVYMSEVVYYLSKGDIERAREFNAKAEKLRPTSSWVAWFAGAIAAKMGDREKALLAIRKIEDRRIGPIGFSFIGFVYHALGDMDLYFEYMNKALEAHELIPTVVMYSPLLAKSREDPRYHLLVEKFRKQVGLAK